MERRGHVAGDGQQGGDRKIEPGGGGGWSGGGGSEHGWAKGRHASGKKAARPARCNDSPPLIQMHPTLRPDMRDPSMLVRLALRMTGRVYADLTPRNRITLALRMTGLLVLSESSRSGMLRAFRASKASGARFVILSASFTSIEGSRTSGRSAEHRSLNEGSSEYHSSELIPHQPFRDQRRETRERRRSAAVRSGAERLEQRPDQLGDDDGGLPPSDESGRAGSDWPRRRRHRAKRAARSALFAFATAGNTACEPRDEIRAEIRRHLHPGHQDADLRVFRADLVDDGLEVALHFLG